MGRKTDLGDLEQTVLLAVWRLGHEAYGLPVRDEIASRMGRKISVSSAYLTMVRLQEKGLLRSQMAEPIPVPGGKARRYFQITRSGTTALRRLRKGMNRMWEGLDDGRTEARA